MRKQRELEGRASGLAILALTVVILAAPGGASAVARMLAGTPNGQFDYCFKRPS